MTREHKLSLIVGFSLVLLVGVLISDHLSRARQSRIASVAEAEAGAPVAVVPPAADPLRPLDVALNGPGVGGTAEQSGPLVMESTPAPTTPVLMIEQGRSVARGASGTTNAPVMQAGDDSPLSRAIQQAGGMMVSGADGVTDIIMPPFAAETAKVAAKPDAVATAPKGGAEGAGAAVPATGRTLATNTPSRFHSVKRGETLFQIAAKHYGTGHVWRELARFNGIEDKEGVVRVGMQLKIPGREALGMKPEVAAAKPEPKPEAAPKKAEPRREAAPVKPQRVEYASYTVKRGDTLGDIALKTLGTSRRWKEIVELNRIKDADNIPAGTVLKIPAMRG